MDIHASMTHIPFPPGPQAVLSCVLANSPSAPKRRNAVCAAPQMPQYQLWHLRQALSLPHPSHRQAKALPERYPIAVTCGEKKRLGRFGFICISILQQFGVIFA